MDYKIIDKIVAYPFYCIDCHHQWMRKTEIVEDCPKCKSKNTVGPKQSASVGAKES